MHPFKTDVAEDVSGWVRGRDWATAAVTLIWGALTKRIPEHRVWFNDVVGLRPSIACGSSEPLISWRTESLLATQCVPLLACDS